MLPRHLVPLLVLLLLVAVPFASPLPTPSSNDAESGTDAADEPRTAWKIGEGEWAGTLNGAADEYDYYRIRAPEKVVVRVLLQSDPAQLLAGELMAPDGRATFAAAGHEMSLAAPVGGDFIVSVRNSGWGSSAVAYTLTVALEPHEHFRELTADGRSAAYRIASPADAYGRVEFAMVPTTDALDPDGNAGVAAVRWHHPDFGCWTGMGYTVSWAWGIWHTLTGRSGMAGEDIAWWNVPGTHQGTVGTEGFEGMIEGSRWEPFALESRNEFSISFGMATEEDLRHIGWVVWDGPHDPVQALGPVEHTIADLQDFERDSEDPAVQAGPLALVQASRIDFQAGGPDGNATVLIVDATTPKAGGPYWGYHDVAATETEAVVASPHGETVRVVDDVFFRTNIPVFNRAPDVIQAGEWSAEFNGASGAESDHPRVIAATFPFSLTCS